MRAKDSENIIELETQCEKKAWPRSQERQIKLCCSSKTLCTWRRTVMQREHSLQSWALHREEQGLLGDLFS